MTSIFLAVAFACQPRSTTINIGPEHPGANDTAEQQDTEAAVQPTEAKAFWTDVVQPLIASQCNDCHLGHSFGVIQLKKDGTHFTAAETEENYKTFFNLISLDDPENSRLLAKVTHSNSAHSMTHVANAEFSESDRDNILKWIEMEKAEKCPDCGLTSPTSRIAYIDQPRQHWAIDREPSSSEKGYRFGATIMMQEIDNQDMTPVGEPFPFLPESFCGPNNACDFGHLAVNHNGTMMAFECRLSLNGDNWLTDVRWNICVADINDDGTASNPRFLRKAEDRAHGSLVARNSPLGLVDQSGSPLEGVDDPFWAYRDTGDFTPAFSPDDKRILFSSRMADPRTGVEGYTAANGEKMLAHLVSVKVGLDENGESVDGEDIQTVYRNEGGEVDFPLFIRNGNLTFHTWNLERIDRHIYVQSTADGMMEIPILFGRTLGPNMWGKYTVLNNGLVFGTTGIRRPAINYVTFIGDHTLGLGMEPGVEPYVVLDRDLYNEIVPVASAPDPTQEQEADELLQPLVQSSYCENPPYGQNCQLSAWMNDPSWSPDGRALIAYTNDGVHLPAGQKMFDAYGSADPGAVGQNRINQTFSSLSNFLPQNMGIALADHHGGVEMLLTPDQGRSFRYPVWVGKRQAPESQTIQTDESKETVDLHIANVPIWMSLRITTNAESRAGGADSMDKSTYWEDLKQITAIRVMVKEMEDNACLDATPFYERTVNAGRYANPNHLGISDASGFVHLYIPESMGGNGRGDVPLKADGSVYLRLPAGALLHFQGIDEQGFKRTQRARIFSLPPGHDVDTSVSKHQYYDKCSYCHGQLMDPDQPNGLEDLRSYDEDPIDYQTQAKIDGPVDLTQIGILKNPATFLHQIRPILDSKCVSCHSGDNPSGELSLTAAYSETGNYPKGNWSNSDHTLNSYLSFIPPADRVPAYNWSVSSSWALQDAPATYQDTYIDQNDPHKPMGELTPWDSGYQNLFRPIRGTQLKYLSANDFINEFGRAEKWNGAARYSYLLEILTGSNLDPNESYYGWDHTSLLTDTEINAFKTVIDTGFPFMGNCSDKQITAGPNVGSDWGDPQANTAQ